MLKIATGAKVGSRKGGSCLPSFCLTSFRQPTEAAKNAQDASQKLYLCVYLARRQAEEEGAPLYEEGMVVDVGERSFDIIVPRYGLEKRVWLEDLVDGDEIVGSAFDGELLKLKVAWKKKGADLGDFLPPMTPTSKESDAVVGSVTAPGAAVSTEDKDDNVDTVNEEAMEGDVANPASPTAEHGATAGMSPVIRRMEQLAVQLGNETAGSSSGFESDVSSDAPPAAEGSKGDHAPKTPTSERLSVLKPPTPFLTPAGKDVDEAVLSEVNRVDDFVEEVGFERQLWLTLLLIVNLRFSFPFSFRRRKKEHSSRLPSLSQPCPQHLLAPPLPGLEPPQLPPKELPSLFRFLRQAKVAGSSRRLPYLPGFWFGSRC